MKLRGIGFLLAFFVLLSVFSVSFASEVKYIDKQSSGPYMFVGQSSSTYFPIINLNQPLVVTGTSIGYGV
jgi:hypothetical protein